MGVTEFLFMVGEPIKKASDEFNSLVKSAVLCSTILYKGILTLDIWFFMPLDIALAMSSVLPYAEQ